MTGNQQPTITMSAVAKLEPACPDVARLAQLTPAEVVQFLAHDLRQPLSTIEAIAFYLELILPREDERTREQVFKLHALLEQFHWMLNNGLNAASESPARPVLLDLNGVVTQALAAQQPGIEELKLDPQPLVGRLDASLASSAIGNAVTLMRGIGNGAGTLRLSTSRAAEGLLLVFELQLPHPWRGVLPPGKTLSLACLRKFADLHGGSVDFEPEAAGGPKLQICLPPA